MLMMTTIMNRPRLMPRVAATLCVAIFSVRAWAAAPSSQQGHSEPRRDETPSPPVEEVGKIAPPRRTAIYFIYGFGTPEGNFGIEAVHRFGDYFELAAGIGEGYAAGQANPNADATQWSFMPRVRSGDDRRSFTFGAGVSGGPYATESNVCVVLCGFPGAQQQTFPTFYTLWANVEIGGEYWSRGGFAFRYYLGYAHGMPLSGPSWLNTGLDIPYFGMGLGFAL
jgi:hypothetical protein